MADFDREQLPKSKLVRLREKWSEPDKKRMETWDFDGVSWGPEHFMSYDHEMREGLSIFGCKAFDELVVSLGKKLGRKPKVIDLMGGAYFVEHPENTDTIVGIRIHPKDEVYLEVSKAFREERRLLYERIIGAKNRRVVDADVLSGSGWKTIQSEKMALADLLVCRPVGPFDDKRAMASQLDNPMTYAGLYVSLFKRMLKLVNRKDGIIFCEIPDIYSEAEAKDFFESIDREEGSETKIFTVPDREYQWGGAKRRYVVVQFGKRMKGLE